MSSLLYPFIVLIVSLPVGITLIPMILFDSNIFRVVWLFFVPFSFSIFFVLISGLLSRIGKKGIIPGKFPRDPKHPIYGLRRIYGFCWTALYYFKPLYWLVLSLPLMKKLAFRLFGYKNGMKFTVYPDTWIRDLPLLSFDEKAYIANRATLGTNMCLNDGTILVDHNTFGASTMVGHLAMIAPGVTVGAHSEVGTGAVIGVRVNIGEKSKLGPFAGINHGAVIGNNVIIGPASNIGLRATIKNNIRIPFASNIPAGAVIESQSDVERYISSETEVLKIVKNNIGDLISKYEALVLNEENANIA